MTPLSMAETLEIVETIDKSEEKKETITFLKKFIKIKPEDAKKLRAELENSGIMKINAEHIVKIIDLLPETETELNKIFVNESLDGDETNKILEIVKKHL